MSYNSDVFSNQYPVVKKFVLHYISYKELSRIYSSIHLKSAFWTLTIDAHLLQAAVQWCMVFGADGCNPTHWKHLNRESQDELLKRFRNGLPEYLNMGHKEWEEYWKAITDFRNHFAVHRILNYDKPVPHFDAAVKVAFYYDEWIREVIFPDIFEEPPLNKSSDEFQKYIRQVTYPLLKFSLNIEK